MDDTTRRAIAFAILGSILSTVCVAVLVMAMA